MQNTAENYRFYDYSRNKKSDTLLIAYGITSRIILPLKERFSIFKPVTIFPVLENEIKEAAEKHRRIIVIEMNDGQYRGEIQKILNRKVENISILGGSIKLKEIEEALNEL